jgi:phosphatidylinositol alpha-mannosyltransferase
VRIALVCPYAWDDAGGVQVHVRELGERLHVAGHEVLALTPARSRPSEPWVHGVGRPVDMTYNASNAPIDPRPWSAARIREELRRFAPAVVHVHEPFAPSTSLWAVLTWRAPIVATFHSGATRSRLYDVAGPALRLLSRRLSIRIAVSEAAAAFARRRIGGSFEIVPNGLDVAAFETAVPADLGDGIPLLFLGRLDERKGFPTALAAFARLAPGRAYLRLVVAGDGPDRRAVDEVPEEIRGRIRLLGSVPHGDVAPFLAAGRVYLGASIGGESFGYVLIEAMAAGVPVVASDVPGYDEVVRHEVDGLLVPPRNPEALAAGVGRVLDDPGLARRLADAGRERARAFDWSVVVPRLESLYRRAVEARIR